MAENEKKVPETAEVSEKETKAVKKEAKSKKDKKPSRVIAWFRTTKAELKKISWTPKKTLIKNTAIDHCPRWHDRSGCSNRPA